MSSRDHPDVPKPRPLRKAFADIAVFGVGATFLTLLVSIAALEWVNPALLIEAAYEIGDALLDDLSWILPAYLFVLVTFYVIVLSGQLASSPSEPSIRRSLGWLAVALTAAFTPGLLVVLVVSATEPVAIGRALMALPLVAILYYFAAKLGSLVVFTSYERRNAALSSIAWVRETLPLVAWRSERSPWLVVACTAAGAVIAGTTISLLTTPEPRLIVFWLAAWSVCSTLVAMIGYAFWSIFLRARERIMTWLTLALLGAIYGGGVAVAVSLAIQGHWGTLAALAAAIVPVAISTFWPPNRGGRFFRNWTIRGSGAATAHRELVATAASAEKELAKLKAEEATGAAPVAVRLQRAIDVLRSN